MSTARNIPNDRGLNFRMFTTGLMIVLLYGAVIGLLIAVGISYVIVLVFAAAVLFVQYWFSDKIALFGMGGRVVTPEEAPELHGAIDRLCAMADMKKPRVAIADSDVPNAFATGRSPKNAVVCATTGLMRRLDESELEAVLAHELSHVAHRDVAVMTIASFLGMVAGLVTRMMLWAGLMGGFGGGDNDNDNQGGDNAALVELAVLAVSVAVYAISFMLTMALSRYRWPRRWSR
jgi:heat shock protein HtpX